MAAFIVPPPPPFIINDNKVEERFIDYKNKFQTFMKANGLDSKEEGQKIAIFKSYCGEDLCEQIEADETDSDSLNDVLQRLHDHYMPAANIVQERFNFFIRRQRPSENFDKYLIELKKIAKNCNFGELEESLLKVALIANMRDFDEQKKYLKDADSKKLEILVPDFRKFDAEHKKKNGNNKNQFDKNSQQQNQPQKQNNPQPQKQNNPQPQKQNNPQPQKDNNPQKQNQAQSQKQNPPKPKQQPDSNKKEFNKNLNTNGNAEPKDKKGNPVNDGNPGSKDKKPHNEKRKKKPNPQNNQPIPQNGEQSSDLFAKLADRIKNLTT